MDAQKSLSQVLLRWKHQRGPTGGKIFIHITHTLTQIVVNKMITRFGFVIRNIGRRRFVRLIRSCLISRSKVWANTIRAICWYRPQMVSIIVS